MKKLVMPEKKTGVWLDQEKAFIITMKGEEVPETEKIKSNMETRVRIPGETKVFARFGSAFIDNQEKQQKRQVQQRQRYFKEIISRLQEASYIALFGPGKARHELLNAIEKDPVLKTKVVAVEPADKLTKAQMVAWVKNYYAQDAFRQVRKKMKKEKALH